MHVGLQNEIGIASLAHNAPIYRSSFALPPPSLTFYTTDSCRVAEARRLVHRALTSPVAQTKVTIKDATHATFQNNS